MVAVIVPEVVTEACAVRMVAVAFPEVEWPGEELIVRETEGEEESVGYPGVVGWVPPCTTSISKKGRRILGVYAISP